MTKLLDDVIKIIQAWPPGRQDDLARIALRMNENGASPYVLTADEEAAVALSMAETDRGEFASDEEVEAAYSRFDR